MAKERYSCDELVISHEQLKMLRQSGDLNLGMNDALAAQISNDPNLGPAKNSSGLAFHFWSWVAVGVFGYSIYMSVTDAWWWFIPGFVLMSIIWKANKKGNSENLLDAAFSDADFYERVRTAGGWIYEIEEARAHEFKA